MKSYIPHTVADRQRMLAAIGVASLDELFAPIPEKYLLKDELPLPLGVAEEEVFQRLKKLAALNQQKISFLGMGSYDRIVPAAVQSIASLPAFVTAYTPYQAEMSQGLLQAIFEYQSMICELTGMDVSNASLYDGFTAATEAASIMLSSRRKSDTILVSQTLHPFTLEVLKTWALGTNVKIEVVKERGRRLCVEDVEPYLHGQVAGLIVQSPNRYGIVEDYTSLAQMLHTNACQLTISSDPLALVLQKSQGEWGADIAIGDTQPLGLVNAFGGPSCGYIAVRKDLMRKIPGRVVGQTLDIRGNRGFVLTLQAREPHIKRERATSNICSNQALAALTTAAYIALVGEAGLKEVATQSYDKAHYLAGKLRGLSGISLEEESPFWCEFPLIFETPQTLERALKALSEAGIWGGVRLGKISGKAEDESTLIVAVSEKRTKEDLDLYSTTLQEALK
ncbi:MAG: aminomethyl-transferring glycine dehydrogenase subunit GcvPA [Sphaerochaetaceae bacterium]